MTDDPDRVEKSLDVRAPRSRVWRAISDAREFGTWFGLGEPLELQGTFEPGGRILVRWAGRREPELFCTIERVEPERLLAFRWVPYEIADGDDPARHPTTLIEMRLADCDIGTRLTISESGFAALPADKQYKRDQNGMGWAIQLQSIAQHLVGGVAVRVEERIARPPAEVFAAIGEPAKLLRYLPGATTALDIQVGQLDPDAKLGFGWMATGYPTKVTLMLDPDGSGGTHLTIVEAPFALTHDGVSRALEQTQRWTRAGCRLAAQLEHGIDLGGGRAAADHVA